MEFTEHQVFEINTDAKILDYRDERREPNVDT